MALTLDDVRTLFARHGHVAYSGEPVNQLEHALQTAHAAEQAGAHDALITAALLHDLGHLLNLQGETPSERGIDDQHQYFAMPFLRGLFPDAVLEPIRLHVDAKRALCALDAGYHDALSEDSKRSLQLQGGIFGPSEVQRFTARPFAEDAMRLRRWDDAAKVAGAKTADLAHYLDTAARCAVR
jgi:phosphonate degradation associated HDIG domain protein